ncbi:hypothetical protein BDV12DRAFT_209881 [Aspergillus spectabilis]
MTLNTAQKTNLSVIWILGGIATTTVFTRMYVCFFQKHKGGEGLIYFAKCLAATSASLASIAIHYGLGVDLNDIQSPDDKVNALRYLTLAPSPSILSVALGKISIVLFFHRLLGLSIAAVVAVVAFCIPTQSIWDKTIPPKSCMEVETQLGIGLAQASVNAFTDIVLGLLLAYSFWNLQMPLRRKIGLMLLFGVGVFGCVIEKEPQMFVLITCANIPMIRSLFRRIFNLQSFARASYPLQSTPKSKSLSGRTKDRYFSLGNSRNNTQNSISAARGTRRNSVDRMYPLTRQDSPPDPYGGGEKMRTGSQRGIVKGTEFSVSYS